MLNIIDINTSAANLGLVETLKADLRSRLSPTVNKGTVVIISKFPAVGNMLSGVDYLILLSIPKATGNYLSVKINKTHKYIHNAVLLIKTLQDDHIDAADDAALYAPDSEFDYNETLSQNAYDLRDFCLPKEDIWPVAIYQVTAANAPSFFNSKLLLNHPLTAKYLVWAMAHQAHEKTPAYGLNSFSRDSEALQSEGNLIDFCKNLLDRANSGVNYGILTKKKIDQLNRTNKVTDEILNNLGTSLSIISGKAGTGKTLALTRVLSKYQQERHNVRFLTYNNLLVFDIRQLLRNFPGSDTKLSAMSVHSFFYKQSHTLGIPLLLGQDRVEQLLQVCEQRISKLVPAYQSLLDSKHQGIDQLLQAAGALRLPKSDYEELGLFARFARGKGWPGFAEIQKHYLEFKRSILEKNIGREIFLQDYYKVLELLYLAVTNTEKFYRDMGIKNRYDLLSSLYDTDKYTHPAEVEAKTEDPGETPTIPLGNLLQRVNKVERQVGWAKLMLVDESQDFHLYEKELLFALRRPENMAISTGGKEQLIRHNKLLDWSLSMNRKIPHQRFPLRNRTFRQKANIVSLVNALGAHFGIPLSLESVDESQGLGKIIIDTRPKTSFIAAEIALELRDNGRINGCSAYESLMFLVPSRGYTDKHQDEGFSISENDVVSSVQQSTSRKFKYRNELLALDILSWDGVSENKGALKIPQQTETRVIHYESCRGLEAWSCALLSLDSYFNHKREAEEAAKHLADDLFLSEDERKDKYAAIWCLMAFTRPMDTLYIQLDSPISRFSRLLLGLAAGAPGITVLE
ncbi:DUF2075 domain-containing protein [Pedobacter aquatilis]|uniref:DNA/RNA helicase domain-containing protein n=1 Tax=Pedobacter aquatilis TaxID=351343 RepID=UPI0025B30C72|nr:DNA/RNA helicase domain-containing protein [Pedobacter aquatilis]MDN3586095.1 DUF2075 domain-containing protein [Pedobacter aquatilis]